MCLYDGLPSCPVRLLCIGPEKVVLTFENIHGRFSMGRRHLCRPWLHRGSDNCCRHDLRVWSQIFSAYLRCDQIMVNWSVGRPQLNLQRGGSLDGKLSWIDAMPRIGLNLPLLTGMEDTTQGPMLFCSWLRYKHTHSTSQLVLPGQ